MLAIIIMPAAGLQGGADVRGWLFRLSRERQDEGRLLWHQTAAKGLSTHTELAVENL